MEREVEITSAGSGRTSLGELARLFLRLGTTAFGGPAAHTAMMQEEVVVRRKWFTATEFLDMMAATNFIPGPNSTEMAIHIGYRRAGMKGLVVAGACFIVPAAVICTLIAMVYVRYRELPVSQAMLWGVKPVVMAVVGQALWKLGKAAVKTWVLGVLMVVAVVGLLGGVNELLVLFGTGVVMGVSQIRMGGKGGVLPFWMVPVPGVGEVLPGVSMVGAGGEGGAPLGMLFLIFMKIGSVLFGSGYVLLAFLRSDFVERYHWLTERELLDAIAVGQVTPGPVFTTATFIGYVVSGPMGAVLATVGIFLPAFFFVAVSAPLLPAMRRSKVLGAFLDGLNVASLGLMAVVTWELGKEALVTEGNLDVGAVALLGGSLALLLWKQVNSAWLVLGGAAIGALRVWMMSGR